MSHSKGAGLRAMPSAVENEDSAPFLTFQGAPGGGGREAGGRAGNEQRSASRRSPTAGAGGGASTNGRHFA